MKKGNKSGLFKSIVGLNMTIRHDLFKYGRIRIRCVGEIKNFIKAKSTSPNSRDMVAVTIPKTLERQWEAKFLGKWESAIDVVTLLGGPIYDVKF